MKQFTHKEVNTALCVWECINEWSLEGDGNQPKWVEFRDGVGSLELRHQSIALSQWLEEVYDLCIKDNPDIFDSMPFDFEVVPLILENAVDPSGCPVIYEKDFPTAEATAATIKKQMFKVNWYNSARTTGQTYWGYADLINDHPERTQAAFEDGVDPEEFVKDLGHHFGLTRTLT